MSPSRARPPTRRPAAAPGSGKPGMGNRSPLATRLVLGGLVVAVAAALVIALVAGGGDDGDGEGGSDRSDTSGVAEAVTVHGEDLPPLPDQGDDPAVGSTMPTLAGTDIHGRPVTIAADGRPTMIMFLAHWCPHCRREVPVVQRWVDDGGLPEGVRLLSVATANDPRRPNYPAVDWLDGEGWTAPALLDDADSEAAIAGGLTAFPFWVLVGADGKVVARTVGELTPAQLTDLATSLAGE
jgi:cytochrome c biogenesis protein CcmG, thiol:disulfide interchange protein DsbE